MKKAALVFFLILIGSIFIKTKSVPAYPYVIELTQPDGSKINVRLIGSENSHRYISEDNYTLTTDSLGYFTYALLDKNGNLVPSKFRAHNIAARTNEELAFLRNHFKGLTSKTTPTRYTTETRTKLIEAASNNRRNKTVNLKSTTAVTPTKYLVILVNFSDLAFQKTNTDFANQLNQVGYVPAGVSGFTGSVKDYYSENSMGKFIPQYDVFGPVTLPQPESYYGANLNGNDIHPREMVLDACAAAKTQYGTNINFKQYDNNNDGIVDNVFIIFAGHPESSGAGANTIWPHQWTAAGSTSNRQFDNTLVASYACSAELSGAAGNSMDGIGTFCHEFGHVLGLPDLYDTDYAVNGLGFDPGPYCLMASGAYNNGGNTPPYLSIFERELLGWSSSTELFLPNSIQNLQHIGASNQAYYFETNPVPLQDSNSSEWYYLENRQQIKWDSSIPGHGLMITHLDMSKEVIDTLWNMNKANSLAAHQCYDLIEADDDRKSSSRVNDLFPTFADVNLFTDTSIPSAKSWANVNTEKPITNIVEANNLISLQFMTPSTVGQVETKKSTLIKNTTAQLNGTVVAGSPTKVGFCWSTQSIPTKSNAYGYSTISNSSFSYSLTGLQPNTIYYIRSFSENSNSTIQQYSNIKAFLTTNISTEVESTAALSGIEFYAIGNQIKVDGLYSTTQITIFDISGKMVEVIHSASSTILSKPLNNGIYVVTIQTQNENRRVKIIVRN